MSCLLTCLLYRLNLRNLTILYSVQFWTNIVDFNCRKSGVFPILRKKITFQLQGALPPDPVTRGIALGGSALDRHDYSQNIQYLILLNICPATCSDVFKALLCNEIFNNWKVG